MLQEGAPRNPLKNPNYSLSFEFPQNLKKLVLVALLYFFANYFVFGSIGAKRKVV